jgi:hypothetical protein
VIFISADFFHVHRLAFKSLSSNGHASKNRLSSSNLVEDDQARRGKNYRARKILPAGVEPRVANAQRVGMA